MADIQKSPDPMADRAPAHVKRTVTESANGPTPGIEVGLPYYRENLSGQLLDHTMYVDSDPTKDYRFCTQQDKFGAARSRGKGFVAEKDPKGKEISIGGMLLCSRPVAYKDLHDKSLRERTLIQARKHRKEHIAQSAAESLGIDPKTIIGNESTITTEVMMPSKAK